MKNLHHYSNPIDDQEIAALIILVMFLDDVWVVNWVFEKILFLVQLIENQLIHQMNKSNEHVIDDDPTNKKIYMTNI
jgi:hypothetical protein